MRRSMKKLLLIASLVMALARVCCSTTTTKNLTIGEEAASGQQELQINELPSDQQELRGSNESRLVKSFDEVSFELKGGTAKSYNDFMAKLRNALRGSVVKTFPMLRGPSAINDKNRFLLVKLSNIKGDLSTTLAMRVSDGYVVGFCCGKYDMKDKKDTAWFFTPDNAAFGAQNKLLFKDKKHEQLGFKGNYDSLGKREIPLGRKEMDLSIKELSETEKGKAASTKSLLVLLQMVAEAARYRYISVKVAPTIPNLVNRFTPDPLMISYQNNWGALSTGVATSDSKGVFKNQLVLTDKFGKVLRTVTKVDDIKNDLSLLTFVRT